MPNVARCKLMHLDDLAIELSGCDLATWVRLSVPGNHCDFSNLGAAAREEPKATLSAQEECF
jgi:hypothetical protein